MAGLRGLASRLGEIQEYLGHVVAGKMPVSHDIMYLLQDVFNLLPNLNVEELARAFSVKWVQGPACLVVASCSTLVACAGRMT